MSFFKHLGMTKTAFHFDIRIRSAENIASPFGNGDGISCRLRRHKKCFSTKVALLDRDVVMWDESLTFTGTMYRKRDKWQSKIFTLSVESDQKGKKLCIKVDLANYCRVEGSCVKHESFVLTRNGNPSSAQDDSKSAPMLRLTICASDSKKTVSTTGPASSTNPAATASPDTTVERAETNSTRRGSRGSRASLSSRSRSRSTVPVHKTQSTDAEDVRDTSQTGNAERESERERQRTGEREVSEGEQGSTGDARVRLPRRLLSPHIKIDEPSGGDQDRANGRESQRSRADSDDRERDRDEAEDKARGSVSFTQSPPHSRADRHSPSVSPVRGRTLSTAFANAYIDDINASASQDDLDISAAHSRQPSTEFNLYYSNASRFSDADARDRKSSVERERLPKPPRTRRGFSRFQKNPHRQAMASFEPTLQGAHLGD